MKLTYDPRYNIAYIRFREKSENVETIQLSDDVNVDIAPDGSLYGIELLNANEQLRREDKGKFLLINEATGKQSAMEIFSDAVS
ncbi:MAG: DUF2283 domain-containing protein [Ignavibacteriales bacterium]|nr:DUF2283 domain-containing protein [Ignavibacteriales bacterium]